MATEPPIRPPYFIAEQPAGRGDDVLFEASTLGPQLQRVADHIVQSALGHGPSPSITFLVSGKWGSGKSSALRYIRDHIAERAHESVVFAHYSAPLYETRPSNARATLMYVLIRATDEHAIRHPGDLADTRASSLLSGLLATAFAPNTASRLPSAPTSTDFADLVDVQNQLLLCEALEHSTRAGVVLEHWLNEYRRRRGQHNPTTVVFVDDLDRCSAEFATEVLTATNYWSQLSGHFFVLGAEEERLKAALGEHMDRQVGAPDRGLRKYVHVTVDLSATLGRVADGKRLFAFFLERIALDPSVKAELQRQLDLVADDPAGPWTVLEPLVNAGCSGAPDAYTPRIFKERFNSLASKLGSTRAPVEALSPLELKRQVIMLLWPAEWRDRVWPAHLGVATAAAWCAQFGAIGALASREPRAAQARSVQQLADQSGLIIEDVDPLLAIYLASDPIYSVETGLKIGAAPPHLDVPTSEEQELAMSREGPSLSDLSELLSGAEEVIPDDQGRGRMELSQALSELQLVAELGDEARMRTVYSRIVGLLPAVHLDVGLAPGLGNVALRLGPRGMVREAAQLHLLAIQADPRHANVNQNFVDFVLDHPFRELYGPAEEALARLETIPEMIEWRPLRTRVLRAAFAVLRGDGPVEDLRGLVAEATAHDADIGYAELVNLLLTVSRSGAWDLLPAVGGELIDRDVSAPDKQAASVRVVADGMAASARSEDEEFAAELYRFSLESGLARTLEVASDVGGFMYNLGVLLASRGQRQRPWYLFWEAFKHNPGDDTIRLRLARSYNDHDNPEAAERLVAGPVTASDAPPPPHPPFDEELLPRSPAAQAWLARHLKPRYAEPVIPEFFGDSARVESGSPIP